MSINKRSFESFMNNNVVVYVIINKRSFESFMNNNVVVYVNK